MRDHDADSSEDQVVEGEHRDSPCRADGVEDPLAVEDLGERQVLQEITPIAGQARLAEEPDDDDGHVVGGEQPDGAVHGEAPHGNRTTVQGGLNDWPVEQEPSDDEEPGHRGIERVDERVGRCPVPQKVIHIAELIDVENNHRQHSNAPLSRERCFGRQRSGAGGGRARSDDGTPGHGHGGPSRAGRG